MISVTATAQTAETIRRNWEQVDEQVRAACDRYGRERASVQIVGVSKYVPAPLCLQLVEAGCPILGENRPQSLWEKSAWFQEHAPGLVRWHLIGHLQRNKVRRTLPLIDCLHSLDSLRLAQELNHESLAAGTVLPVLIEVNVTRDQTKTGLTEDKLDEFVEQVRHFAGLAIGGFMAMASLDGDLDAARREFSRVRELRDAVARSYPSLDLSQLSMGMSGDYEAAIAEGATLVRIGSSLWRGLLPNT
jgi:PLP dependent protein